MARMVLSVMFPAGTLSAAELELDAAGDDGVDGVDESRLGVAAVTRDVERERMGREVEDASRTSCTDSVIESGAIVSV